jgi:hypothetical protein
VTWGFLYLLLFLGGFTLALVTGLVRRMLHPSELCGDQVVAPSHEHWQASHAPRTDLLVAFTTVFGLTTLVIHGVTALDPIHEVTIGAAAGVLGAVVLGAWMRSVCHPLASLGETTDGIKVIRDIPAVGFGQIGIKAGSVHVTLAARSADGTPIPAGTVVDLLDSVDSVAVVRRTTG